VTILALLPRPCGDTAPGGTTSGMQQKIVQINKCGRGGSCNGDDECPFPGGTVGQVLTKIGNDDCEADWRTPQAGGAGTGLNNVMLIIEQSDIDNGFFDIPGCIDVTRLDLTTVFLNSDAKYYGFDYTVGQDDNGDYRRIFFASGLLGIPISADDRVWVFYHIGECGIVTPPPPVGNYWDIINGIGTSGAAITSLNGIPGPFVSVNGITFS